LQELKSFKYKFIHLINMEIKLLLMLDIVVKQLI